MPIPSLLPLSPCKSKPGLQHPKNIPQPPLRSTPCASSQTQLLLRESQGCRGATLSPGVAGDGLKRLGHLTDSPTTGRSFLQEGGDSAGKITILHPVPGTNISPQASCPPAAPLRHLAGKTRPSSPQAQGHLFGLEDDRVTTEDVSLELLHLGGLWCKTRCCVTAQRRGISLSFPLPHAHYWQHLSVSNTSAHI